jgi:hypothetical protein
LSKNAPFSARDSHNRRIELNSSNQHGEENHAAARDGDSSGQDKFAAALDRGLELIDLHLQPHNLAMMIVPIHGGHAGDDKLA